MPLLPLLTVAGIGFAVDNALYPFSAVATFAAHAGGSSRGTNLVNNWARNLGRFKGVEEVTLNLDTAVRIVYAQRRQQAIQEGGAPVVVGAVGWVKLASGCRI